MYTALCLAALDAKTRRFTYSLAAFNEPLLKRRDSTIGLTTSGSVLPLGAFEDTAYQEQSIDLESQDVIVIYTDGIAEARSRRNGFYDISRLKGFLSELDTTALTAKEICEKIIDDVNVFSAGTSQSDDMTVVVVKCAAREGEL
jgi:sigma-B regulation protein RsbU (phosphoserine phosphatase)